MRTEYVEVKTKGAAEHVCPWSAITVKVDGGYMCFESVDDYNLWAKQS